MAEEPRPIVLVHITTVPQSLNFLIGQVGYMKERGFDVHGLSSPGDQLDRFAQLEQVPIHAIQMQRRITPLRDLYTICRIWRCLHSIHPQIVHAHTPKGGLLGIIGAWLARVPIRIYHIHGLPLVTASGYTRKMLRWSEKVSCLLAHQVLCVSHTVREVVIAEKLCPTDKIKVLATGSINGVDARERFNPNRVGLHTREEKRAKYGIPADALVVGFVGRLVRDKGIIELAEAWQALRETAPTLHLLIAGQFEPRDPVPPDVERALRHDPRVHLLGHIDDIPPLYMTLDVLVLPTHREGFPLVLLEAAAMELPVVATCVPGCVDAVVDGITGTLVPPGDAQSLVRAVRIYLDDPELRRKHGQAGRERVLRDFRPEEIWEAVYQEYKRLLREQVAAKK